jgi:hypothetical protein
VAVALDSRDPPFNGDQRAAVPDSIEPTLE